MIEEVIGKYAKIQSGKACCPIHSENTPSLAIYPESDSWFCYGACSSGGDSIEFLKMVNGYSFNEAVEELKEITGLSKEEVLEKKETQTTKLSEVPALPIEDVKAFIKSVGYTANGYRGIRDDICRFYGHVTKLDDSGNVLARYYPETNDKGQVSGWKCRNTPKDFSFGKIGNTGIKSQLSGQVKFKSPSKYVLIVGGEEDKCAAYQMLLDSNSDRGQGEFNAIPVVSPTSGEGSAAKQCAAQYDWLDTHDIIVIGLDNDEAGRKAALEVASVLPKEKVRIATWSSKDPNVMLEQGKQKQFVRDFYNSKELVESGIKTSANLMDAVIEELQRPRISLPPHMHKLQTNTGGGLLQGRIINIIGDTSVGKSVHLNGMVYHWIFNAPERVGIVSLEATDGQYALDMLALHMEKNFQWNKTGAEVIDYLHQPEVKALYDDLWVNEHGEPRFAILDERDGDIKRLEKQIERLINQYGCRIIVIDVLSDILRSLPMDKQDEHMSFQKRIIKSGVTIINALHTRKPGQSQDGTTRKVTEYDALGSGTFVQSAAVNIVINRDKMSENDVIKNSTEVDMPKCRGGITGPVGFWYYDFATRKVWDLDDWNARNAPKDFSQKIDDIIDNAPHLDYDDPHTFEFN